MRTTATTSIRQPTSTGWSRSVHTASCPAALNDLVVGDADLAAFDIRQPRTEALLFQTGYLTILGEEPGAVGVLYRLGYPNREVRSALAWLMAMAPMPAVPWRRSRREATRRSTDTLACPSTKWA